jgi:hypothetical protein
MEQRRPTETDIIDAIIAEATKGQFTGDERDGAPPPITLQNFSSETFRYGAKALRARLSRLTYAELVDELVASVTHIDTLAEYLKSSFAELERNERDANIRARSERQSELAKRSRLQPAIVAAARHYRDQGLSAGEAWNAIRETPFKTDGGSTVEIKGDKRSNVEDDECFVRQPDGRQSKRSIKWDQWRQVYWKAAAKPG